MTDNKADALKIGKEIAKNQQSELTILGKDGKIQNKNGYGNDPFPPKDNKHGLMIDISKQSVKIDCPECKRSISVTIKQVAHEALVKSNKAYTST